MRITSITYSRTKNLGNYESERIEATAEVDEDEFNSDALTKLRDWVFLELGMGTKVSYRSAERENG